MPIANSPLAFEDVRAALDRATESEKGIRIILQNDGSAINMLQRLRRFIKRDRESSKQIYSSDDPRYGISAYDSLSLSREGPTVILRRLTEGSLTIEDIK